MTSHHRLALLAALVLGAAACLGQTHSEGHTLDHEPHAPQDFQKALAAAKRGNVAAEAEVAHMYLYGEGTEPDAAAARLWLDKAIAGHSAAAERDMALLIGVESDPHDWTRAFPW